MHTHLTMLFDLPKNKPSSLQLQNDQNLYDIFFIVPYTLIYFLHYSLLLGILTGLILVVISLFRFKNIRNIFLYKLTTKYRSRNSKQKNGNKKICKSFIFKDWPCCNWGDSMMRPKLSKEHCFTHYHFIYIHFSLT